MPTIAPSATPPAADPKALLAAANSASEKVSALHIVFLAVCAYVLVIVFGTTDMDLLVGKGVKLPVVDVEVPIVGFYALAPYLLVLVHFNLLLSLQLLSRKLYAFDDAAGRHEGLGGLHDQLNIFPYNYYLVGRPSRLVGGFLALVVTITVLLLPLAALLTLQARFLAYQSEAVTWAQRAAIWLDITLVAIFWPVIMDRRDSWGAYIGGVWRHARVHWLRWLWGVAGLLITLSLLVREVSLPRGSSGLPPLVAGTKAYLAWLTDPWWFKLLLAWLLLILLARPIRRCAHWLSRGRYFALPDKKANLVLGAPGLLTILVLGLPLPLMLVVDGEKIDRPAAVGTRILASLRHLDVREKVLLAKPAQPETLADLRGTDPSRREAALRSVQRIDLQNRSLRRADFSHTVLPRADLRGAQLQGAYIFHAQLQSADLRGAQLEGTIFLGARLHGANLSRARLQRTVFVEVWLDGADLSGAEMQGTVLSEVQLQGAKLDSASLTGTNLSQSGLRGASLRNTHLEGANLAGVSLQGVDLRGAGLQGANLSRARLQGANLSNLQLEGANLRAAELEGANLRAAELQGADLSTAQLHGANLSYARLQGANLRGAQLQGANLSDALLWYTKLQGAVLYAGMIDVGPFVPVDARSLIWRPLDAKEIKSLRDNGAGSAGSSKEDQARYNDAIEKAAAPGLKPPQFGPCLRDKDTQVTCTEDLPLEEFRAMLLPGLEKLACQSPDIARGVLRRFESSLSDGANSPTKGLALRLQSTVKNAEKDNSCPGLIKLSAKDKARLTQLASQDKPQPGGVSKEAPPTAATPNR